MVGGKRDPEIRQPNLVAEKIEELRKFVIERQRHGLDFRRVGPDLVTENVIG